MNLLFHSIPFLILAEEIFNGFAILCHGENFQLVTSLDKGFSRRNCAVGVLLTLVIIRRSGPSCLISREQSRFFSSLSVIQTLTLREGAVHHLGIQEDGIFFYPVLKQFCQAFGKIFNINGIGD